MRLLFDNKFLTSTMEASSEDANYLAENMQDTVLSKVYRSEADSTILLISTEITASYIAIMGHNLTEGSTITLEGNATDAWGAPTFSETITYRSDMCILKFTEATFAYWRIVIEDSDSGADGYIEIGSIFLGTYLQMPGMKLDQVFDEVTNSSVSISNSNQAYGEEKYDYRNPNINFPFLSHTLKASILTMWNNNKNIRPMIVLIWANRLDLEAPIYAIIDQKKLSFKRNGTNQIDPFNCKIKFREVS